MKILIHKLHLFLSKINLIVFLAIKIRNQLNAIITFSICNSTESDQNGEKLFLEIISGEIETFIDVGAHTGNYTELLLESRNNTNIKAILFEPSKQAFNQLKTKFNLNNLDGNFEIIHSAVGSELGYATLHDAFSHLGGTGSSFALDSVAHVNSVSSYEVPITTITHEVTQRNWDRVDFLKIDTEGYDFQCLKGSEKLLEEKRIGIIQFEYTAKWLFVGDNLIYAFNYLESFGYNVYLLNGDGLVEIDYKKYAQSLNYANFVAFSPEVVSYFSDYLPD